MKISVCVIGLNEENNLADCLDSVKGVADEIVFVDSFSTDATVKIARRFTKKVFTRKFDNYVAQKNFAAAKARFDWILNLDCDERLSPELRASIVAAKGNPKPGIAAYKFNRLTWYIYRFIRHSGWYPDDKIRLYDRRVCAWEGDQVHEIVRAPADNFVRHLGGDLLHYSYRSIDDHLATIRRYSQMAADALYARGRRVSLAGVFFRAGWVVIRKFFFELSFLDGAAGMIITYYSAVATFTKYIKLYVISKTPHPHPPLHNVERVRKTIASKRSKPSPPPLHDMERGSGGEA